MKVKRTLYDGKVVGSIIVIEVEIENNNKVFLSVSKEVLVCSSEEVIRNNRVDI